jgi:cleavage and polyadenylation specificity factor subunit 3
MSEPEEITLSDGRVVPLRMTVRTISFSAHSDRLQTEEFIASTKPANIVLVHGDTNNCTKLKQALSQKFTSASIYAPKNCETVDIIFRGEKIAKVLGDLAVRPPESGRFVSGVLLHKDFEHHLVAPQDLKTYADITSTGVKQRLMVPLPLARMKPEDKEHEKSYLTEFWKGKLSNRFDHVQVLKDDAQYPNLIAILIGGTIMMKIDVERANEAALEWNSTAGNDILVDGVCNLILDDDNAMSDEEDYSVKDEMQMLYVIQQMLCERYNSVSIDLQNRHINLNIDGYPVTISSSGKIDCDKPEIVSLLEIYMRRLYLVLFPIPSMMGCLDEHDHSEC